MDGPRLTEIVRRVRCSEVSREWLKLAGEATNVSSGQRPMEWQLAVVARQELEAAIGLLQERSNRGFASGATCITAPAAESI